MLHHKVWSSQIRTTLCEEHSESPIRHRLKLPKLLCAFRSDRFIHFGHTEITKSIYVFNLGATDLNISVTPSCSDCLQLCISVPTSCPLGHTDRVRLYISTGQFLEISPNSCARAQPALPPWVSGLSSSSPAASRRWSPPLSTKIVSVVAAVAGPSPHLGYGLDPCANLTPIPSTFFCHVSCHDWDHSI